MVCVKNFGETFIKDNIYYINAFQKSLNPVLEQLIGIDNYWFSISSTNVKFPHICDYFIYLSEYREKQIEDILN